MELPIVKDFPKEGINFIDIFPLFQNEETLKELKEKIKQDKELQSQAAVAIPEARAFLLGGMICAIHNSNLIPFRKPGKLPGMKSSVTYECEYSNVTLEYRYSDFKRCNLNKEVIIVDDILATGETGRAMASVLEEYGYKVIKFLFLTKVKGLEGQEKLEKIAPVEFLV